MSDGFKTFRLRLRAETEPFHRALEVDLKTRGLTGERHDYVNLLAGMLKIYRPLEAALAKLDWRSHRLNIKDRRKSEWLEADLVSLGREPQAIADWTEMPLLDSDLQGMGALYVLEGASLGGQVISKWLREHLDIGAENGGRFFASYGGEVSSMWRSYLDALEIAAAEEDNGKVISAAACRTFEAFHNCLNSAVALPDRNSTAFRAAS